MASHRRTKSQPDAAHDLHRLVSRNVRTLLEARAAQQRQKTRSDRIADAITAFTGSMWFAVVHAVLFGGWLVLNSGVVSGIRPWDPFPFVMLAMWASVEAIFLSTFVLISQNRMAEVQDQRADLDLQINLLAEYEITKLLTVVDAMATKLGIEVPDREAVDILKQEVAPEIVLQEIRKQEELIEQVGDGAAADALRDPPPAPIPTPSRAR